MNECSKSPYTAFIAIILCKADIKYLGSPVNLEINSGSMEL